MGHIITKLTHQERSTKISEKAKEIQLKWMDMIVEEKEKDNSKLKRYVTRLRNWLSRLFLCYTNL